MPDTTELSVQLYTVRAALATDPDGTLSRLAAMGFRLVEPFGLVDHLDVLRTGLRANGLTAPTAHAEILTPADADAAFAAAVELGIGTVVQPWTSPTRWQAPDSVRALADELNGAAERGRSSGIQVGYHNHHFELESRLDGRHALEVFAEHLSPDVVLEVDTYWAYAGGSDVPALLRRLGDRVVALHVKDGDGSLDTKRQVAAGSGSLPVREIVEAAPTALRVVELDDTDGDLFEAIGTSRGFLMGLARG